MQQAQTLTAYSQRHCAAICVCMYACVHAKVRTVCVYAGMRSCLFVFSSVCTCVCLYPCVCLKKEAPVTIIAHRRNTLLWSLTCQHPAGHVVHLHTLFFFFCSPGTRSHTKRVHFCICMWLYARACLLAFEFVCGFASQTSGRSSTYSCYLTLPSALSQTETSLCQMSC